MQKNRGGIVQPSVIKNKKKNRKEGFRNSRREQESTTWPMGPEDLPEWEARGERRGGREKTSSGYGKRKT